MYSFIARQPIFDTKMQTVAYELLFRDGMNNAFPDVSPEYATSRMISDQFLCIPVPRIANNHSSFINVPHQMIINGLGDTLPNEKVVIEILENAVPDDALFCAVKDMHDRGYQLALDDFTMDDEWDRFMQYISVIKFDVRDNDYEDIRQYIHRKSQLLQGIKSLLKKWKQGTSLSFTAGRVSRFSRDFSSVARKSSEINAFPEPCHSPG
jgi:EAL and modified HD-GYP domain-containing signal transduction protein